MNFVEPELKTIFVFKGIQVRSYSTTPFHFNNFQRPLSPCPIIHLLERFLEHEDRGLCRSATY